MPENKEHPKPSTRTETSESHRNKGQQSPGSANVPAVSKETPRLPKPAESGKKK